MNIGECVEVRSPILRKVPGTVVYLHPERRFAVVEMPTPWGPVRESFQLRKAGETEDIAPERAIPGGGHLNWNHGMTKAQQAVAKARLTADVVRMRRDGVYFAEIARRLGIGEATAIKFLREACKK